VDLKPDLTPEQEEIIASKMEALTASMQALTAELKSCEDEFSAAAKFLEDCKVEMQAPNFSLSRIQSMYKQIIQKRRATTLKYNSIMARRKVIDDEYQIIRQVTGGDSEEVETLFVELNRQVKKL